MIDIEKYARMALSECLKECDQAEVLTSIIDRRRVLFEGSKVSYVESSRSSRIGVMAIKNKRVGVASQSSLSEESAREAVSKALMFMRNNEPDPEFETLIGPMKLPAVKDYFDEKLMELSDEELIERGLNIVKLVTSKGGAIIQGELEIAVLKRYLLNSEGVDVYGLKTRILYNFTLMVSENTSASEGFFMRGYTFIDDAKIEDDVEWMLNLTRKTLKPKKVEGGMLDIVLGPDAVYELLRFVLSYVLNGDHARKRRSPFSEKIGSRVFSKEITVIDDGTIPRGYVTFPCDGEGYPMKRKVVIDKGILRTFLLDSYTARKMGVESTGNAGTNRPFPSITPTNLIIAQGTKSLEELIEEVDRGLYIPRIPPAMVNPLTGQFSVELRQAFRIERGELKDAVRWGMLSDNIYGMLNRVISVSRNVSRIYNFTIPAISISDVKVEA